MKKIQTLLSIGGGCEGGALVEESSKPGKFNCCDNWLWSCSSLVGSAGGLDISFKGKEFSYSVKS